MKVLTKRTRARVRTKIRKSRKELETLTLQITTATMFIMGATVAAALLTNTNLM
jgi:hypothetical protein